MEAQNPDIMELIAHAPWREAVTYRETWPHEYVVIQKDGQQELLAEFCDRVLRGEGIEGHFFHQTRPYLFLGGYKYWVMDDVEDIDPETYDSVRTAPVCSATAATSPYGGATERSESIWQHKIWGESVKWKCVKFGDMRLRISQYG